MVHMKTKLVWMTAACLFGMISLLSAQSIAEKKAALNASDSDLDRETEQFLLHVNQETRELQNEIQRLYEEVLYLYERNASEDDYRALLARINEDKRNLRQLEISWREAASRVNRSEGYGLWHAPDTTLEQLIIDYGSQDYVYLIPPEVGSIKLSVDSNLPIPRASWSEMIELILKQNGVGIKTLNPYLRQLYLIKQTNANVRVITNNRRDLEVFPNNARVAFVLSPEPSDVKRSYAFLERFIDPNNTILQLMGRDILLIGQASDVLDLLKLYDFVASNRGDKDYRLVPVYKVRAEEMAKILQAMFDQTSESPPGPMALPPSKDGPPGRIVPYLAGDTNGLKIITLESMAQAIFLVGTKEEIRKAEEVIRSVEGQIGGARDRVVFWYTVKHSDPEELAQVLEKVYNLMIATGTVNEATNGHPFPPGMPGGPGAPGIIRVGPGGLQPIPGAHQNDTVIVEQNTPPLPVPVPVPNPYGQQGFYQTGTYPINPAPIQPGIPIEKPVNQNRQNFIVDIKTGSIVMVIEADILSKMKDLIKRLDVPKTMVHLEVLLFEKRLNTENSFGLNLLRIGDLASKTNASAFTFDAFPSPFAGISQFFLSRKGSSNAPAFDLVYRFLLSQDDIQINSSPSVLTVNQTPAQIAIVEDISINTGIFEVPTVAGVVPKDAFTRAQYGITINITPTVHLRREDDDESDSDYVSLETDITFDTIQPGGAPTRPDVTRRHIVNEVQIPDGQTVVLGGLRRKTSHDSKDAIPFIGELPGIGKLFSETSMSDNNTEMFIMITPHIVTDPASELLCLRQELLCRRPGDIPYFLECVDTAHNLQKNRLMAGSIAMLLGRPSPNFYCPDYCSVREFECSEADYDGR